LFHPRRDVDRAPDDAVLDQLGAADHARDHRPAVDPDADREWREALAGELPVVLGERGAHAERGAHRVARLPRAGRHGAEERQDAVADELRDVALLGADDGAHALEVAVEHADEQLGVELLGEGREALQIGEEDGHVFLLRPRRDTEGDDVVDDRRGREAGERMLESLEAPRGGLEPGLDPGERPPAAPALGQDDDERRDDGGGDRQHASRTTLSRQTAFASARTPTVSIVSSGRKSRQTSRTRSWIAAGW